MWRLTDGRAGLVAGMLLVAASAQGQPIVGDGPEFVVTAEVIKEGSVVSPDVSVGPGDDAVVVWVAPSRVGGGVRARLVPAGGEPLGAAVQVNVATTTLQRDPRIAADDEGYLVVWADRADERSAPHDLVARRLDLAGRPTGDEVRFAGPVEIATRPEPSLATLPGFGFAVVWLADGYIRRGELPSAQVRMRRLDSSGEPLGQEITVDDEAAHPVRAAVAGAHDGRFVVAWSRGRDCSLVGYPWCPGRVSARRYNPGGAPVGSDLLIGQGLYVYLDRAIWVRASALPSGDFVVSWRGGERIVTRVPGGRSLRAVSATEDVLGPEANVAQPVERGSAGEIAATEGGTFLSFFGEGGHLGDDDWDVVLRELDPVTATSAPPLRVSLDPERDQYMAALATTSDGSILAIWHSEGELDDDGSIRGRWLRRGEPLFRDGFESGDASGWSNEGP